VCARERGLARLGTQRYGGENQPRRAETKRKRREKGENVAKRTARGVVLGVGGFRFGRRESYKRLTD
jgi:hypothetical protein